MYRKTLLFAVVSSLSMPVVLRAGEASGPPAIVVRVKSIDAVVDNFKLLAGIAGQEEAATQIEALIKTQVGEQGLSGIDTTKPLGAYVRLGEKPENITGAVLVPVADEKALLGLIEGLNLKVQREDDGLIVIKTNTPFDGYVRIAKGYAYLTSLNRSSLDKDNLVDPGQVFAGKATATVSAIVRLDRLPKQAKQTAIATIEQELQKAQEAKTGGETEKQKAFRIACVTEITKCIASILKEGKEATLNLELDKEKFNFTLMLNGQPNSELAKMITKMGQDPSAFGALKTKNAAFTGALHLVLPESVDAALSAVVDEAAAQVKKSLQDPAKKKQAETLLAALMPTLKGGVGDGHASLVAGPDGTFAGLVAVKVKDGAKLGTTVQDLIADALKDLPEANRDKIKLNFDKVGGTSIHRFELPADALKGKSAQEVFGD